jgi:hypothetical protein
MLATILTAACTALLTIGAFLLLQARKKPVGSGAYRPERVARELLRHPLWRWRTFGTIRLHLGGFGDDELRRILVRAGAVRFETEIGEEIWGLYERIGTLLEGARYPVIGKAFSAIDEVTLAPEVAREVRVLLAVGQKGVAAEKVRAATGLGLTQSSALLERL